MVFTVSVIQVIALIILFIEVTYIALQPPSKLQVILLLLVISTFLMMFGYLLEIHAVDLDSALFGTYISYIGKPMTMLFALLFTTEYIGLPLRASVKKVLVFYHALFILIVCTNSFHHLFYSSVSLDQSKMFSILVLGHGPFYYLYMATIAAYMIIETIITIREFRKTVNQDYRKQIYLIFGMVFSGMMGYFIFMTGLTHGYDSTMAGCFIGTMLLALLFARYRIFDVANLAKDESVKNASSGLIVIDSRDKVVYTNLMAANLLQKISINELQEFTTSNQSLELDGRYYKVNISSTTRNNRLYGHTIEIHDITDSFLYSDRLEKDVAERTNQIKHIQRSIIGSLAEIVEARDSTTGSHIKKTSEYVRIIAEEMQKTDRFREIIDDAFIERLQDTAPMHDIGKLQIPDHILLKPGKLTPEEFEIMKQHSTAGAEIIDRTMRGVESDEYIETAIDVALCHHERWDGKGYPRGLRGEEIPLTARIMAIADVFDALCSPRSYKAGFPVEKAKTIILEGNGTQFDPDVINAFLVRFEEFSAVAETV